jgi:hypothetical protein
MAAPQETGTPTTEPVAAPAADRPKPGGKGSIADRMLDAGWKPEDVGEGQHGEARPEGEPEKPVAPAKKQAKKPPVEAKPDEPAKEEPADDAEKLGALGLLKKLAGENGFVVDDGKLTTKEKAEWRLFKQEQRNQLAAAEKEAIGRVEKAQAELAERYKRVEAVEAALTARDHNAVAKALGFEDFEKFQAEIVAWNADPNYQRMRQLEEWKQKQEAEAEQQAKHRQEQEQQQQRAQAENTYLGNLTTTMKTSQDPLVQSMAEDPLFIRAVYRIQQENWDGRETVTPEQAVRMASQGARVTLMEELKALHDRLGKAFGARVAPAEPKPAPALKPKIASAPKPGPSEPAKFERRQDRMKHYAARLEDAGERDRKAGASF